jgi:YARHG domain
MKKSLVLILCLLTNFSFGQIPKTIFYEDTSEAYESKDFSISKLNLQQFVGVYHFGESEGEWEFVVLPYKDGIIIQVVEGEWSKNVTFWQHNFTTYNKVILEKGNKFKFGKFSGLFVEYNKGENKKAVLLFGNPTEDAVFGKDTAEVGHFGNDLKTYFDGRDYPELSTKVLSKKDLEKKSKQELKFMRNEIFAFYGLLFQSPELTAHFSKKDWYRPWRKEVAGCITEIEKQNIALIKQLESK